VLDPVPRQHLGYLGLMRAIPLPDLLGPALLGRFAEFRSHGSRIDQFLSEAGFAEYERGGEN